MMRNLVQSLIEHERIKTTEARAKELRRVADRVISFGKKGTAGARVEAGKIVRTTPELVKLFTSALPVYDPKPPRCTHLHERP